MAEHNCVAAWTRLDVANEYMYRIRRTEGRRDVIVMLNDAYRFGLAEYIGRPELIQRGSFILIARPEAGFDDAVLERAREDGIGVGSIKKFMGALNRDDVSTYKTPEESEAEKVRLRDFLPSGRR